MWYAFASMWISVGAAVSVTVYVTKSPWPLFALLIPAMIDFQTVWPTPKKKEGE